MQLHEFLYPERSRSDLVHVYQRGCGLSPWTLSWDDVTIFKPLTPTTAADVETNWCIHLPDLIRAVGRVQRFSFLDRPSDWHADAEAATPYRHVRQTILQRLEAGDERFRELADHGTSLPVPRSWAAMQGTLYMRGLHDYTYDPRLFTLLMLSPSAWRATEKLISEPGCRDELLNPSSPTVIEFYQAAWHARTGPRWQLVHEAEGLRDVRVGAYGAGRFLARLIRPVHESVHVPPSTLVKPRFVPWEHVVRQLTVREQFTVLAAAIGPEPMMAACRGTAFEQALPDWVRHYR